MSVPPFRHGANDAALVTNSAAPRSCLGYVVRSANDNDSIARQSTIHEMREISSCPNVKLIKYDMDAGLFLQRLRQCRYPLLMFR